MLALGGIPTIECEALANLRLLRSRSRASALLQKSVLIHDVAFIFDESEFIREGISNDLSLSDVLTSRE
ncbi:hypothetical protein K5D32_15455 [Pseudomonas cichorii]|uniref:hypothetical protein n=1 Tax=Pseudomonas cichorii TaxID=36746 RepID=UPI001C89016D|nr:hypothetical protein [Pseudomonas cichorii]MBX8531069.1 hypothetical protein [Pseudomonas cichorii]